MLSVALLASPGCPDIVCDADVGTSRPQHFFEFIFQTCSRLDTDGACVVTWVGVQRVWNFSIWSHSYRSFANT
jgi:hypothetical protein